MSGANPYNRGLMIQSKVELADLCDKARQSGQVALDTEFVWTRTFWPRLGLIQMGLPDGSSFLIDGLQESALPVMKDLLEDDGVVKILHDAPQDLTILRRATGGISRNVFDSRLAAGFAGFENTLSLNALLKEFLDIELPKTETRTNWTKRPLSEKQIEYALDDVKYLFKLRESLETLIDEKCNREAFNEERRVVEDPSVTDDRDPQDAWSRIKPASRLSPLECAVLRELAAWRENEARELDCPRNTVVDEKLLVELARQQPDTTRDLIKWSREHKETISKYGRQILDAVAAGRAVEESERPTPPDGLPGRQTSAVEKVVDACLKLRETRAQETGIAAGLMATKGEIQRLVIDGTAAQGEHHRLLNGWRLKTLGRPMMDLLTSQSGATG